jgi:hypothetical protein
MHLCFLCVLCVLCGSPSFIKAIDIEGVQPAALDQPRVHMHVRRDPKGPALSTGKGEEQTINIQAFLDTGASGIMLSTTSADALKIKREEDSKRVNVRFRDVGVGGGDQFNVSEPLYVFVAPFSSKKGDPVGVEDYPIAIAGPIRAQVGPLSPGVLEMLTGGLDVLGMPAIKGHIVCLDPKPVDTFADTMRSGLFKKNDPTLPKTDRHIHLTMKSFARFTKLQPPTADPPTLADNPFIDNVVVTFGAGKQSTGSWLLDTGAAASMISTKQAEKLGVTYVDGSQDTNSPKLNGIPEDEQFAITVGGVGGSHKAAGFFMETLTLPTREDDKIVYRKAPVLISDITVEDPKTKETITLDGVFGMNFLVASAMVNEGVLPDLGKMSAGAYQWIVIDPDAGELGLKVKPELAKAEARNPKIEIRNKSQAPKKK